MRKLLTLLLLMVTTISFAQKGFVSVKNIHFIVDGKPYYYIGANYWYGGLLGNDAKGKTRIKTELDFLLTKGVNNLRILAGTEGTGTINGFPRVEPALQTAPGMFDTSLLHGLDFLLSEMNKRNMKAVIYFSNNWEWSGGFLQYLNWNGKISDSALSGKLAWDDMRDYISGFYNCFPCVEQYNAQLDLIVTRTNAITGKKYKDDPTIMSWELANEPRPMRPAAIPFYKKWISNTAARIKKLDKKHLVTIGSEGEIGSENMDVFKEVHSDKNIDYTTIHIWPKNWQWFSDTAISKDMLKVHAKTSSYIDKHIVIARQLKKPLVIEEFGLPRNQVVFTPGSDVSLRDAYYRSIFEILYRSFQKNDVIAGANFWSFGGTGRPSGKQLLWKKGDDMLGDPPVEEQGLNSVFDNDLSTWNVITFYTRQFNEGNNPRH